MRKVVKYPQKWHVTDILHLLLVGSTPLGTFLFLKNDEYIYRPRQCGQMQFFRLGACWGDQEAATGGRMSVTP